jgi:hypothetical protein
MMAILAHEVQLFGYSSVVMVNGQRFPAKAYAIENK